MFLANFVNNLHDLVIQITSVFNLDLTDKKLHFWLIGLIGLLVFLVSDMLFKFISKWSITIISFIYTFTVLIVLVFGLEIEQKITGRGSMEFSDIVSGLWGFIVLFSVYLSCRIIIGLVGKTMNKKRP
ncbi:hypothetical protein SAMN05660649_05041 [Desulfotomaculum arcticum]|uniref:Uncharacterized protein n=2 Tax=Desulfotruncus TaxID=2867377 RepID=A0A1I2ZNQ2_9FIRM|nr:hypothetical protein SAMN05660649_05041 [Desulfotomaculum arcticum] [Desulfotruncus arcticus DSM 17038]